MLSHSDRKRSLVGVIASMAVVNLVYGITFPLLALVLDDQGINKTLIGLSTITQAAAVFAIVPMAPGLLIRYAPARLMQTSTVVLALLFILAGLYPNVYFWFPLRFVIGALTALLWIASEALINELAEERWRGRVVGLYASVGGAGFALGPALLIATGSDGLLPFVCTSVLVLVAGIPLFMVRRHDQGFEQTPSHGIWKVFLMAPVIMLINVVYAAVVESMITFFPLYGIHLGLGEHFALGLMTIMGLGSMILILPLSWLADHVNRMGMLVVCLVVTMFGLLLMPYLVHMTATLAAVYAFAFGGIEGMIYALGVVLIGERFKGALLAVASTAFTACWGAGSVIGPLLSGFAMDWLGTESMVYMLFMFLALYLPLPIRAWARSGKSEAASAPGS